MDTAKHIINQLKDRHGLTDQAIAEEVDSTQPTIWRVRTGTNDSTASMYIKLVQLLKRLDDGVHTAADAADAPGIKPCELGVSLESTPGA